MNHWQSHLSFFAGALLATATGCNSQDSGNSKDVAAESGAGGTVSSTSTTNGSVGGTNAGIGGTSSTSSRGGSTAQSVGAAGSTMVITGGAGPGGAASNAGTGGKATVATAGSGNPTFGGSTSSGGRTGAGGGGGKAGSGGTGTGTGTGGNITRGGNSNSAGTGTAGSGVAGSTSVQNPLTNPADGVAAGNPEGKCAVPAGAGLEDVSTPTKVVGDGTAASCTGDAVVAAVWNGGAAVNRVTFNCGADPITITLTKSIQVPNAPSGASTVIDGGGKVTLSGGGTTRILYSNACNNTLGWYTDHCQDQDSPHLAVQNLTFIDGNAADIAKTDVDEPSGGAIFMRSGRLKVVNCRFFNNRAIAAHSDWGGGAIRVLGQYNNLPVTVVNSTFGGKPSYGNVAANGGALSSIGTSWTVINSLFSYNSAIGTGANDGNGGNGGAIYNDGNLILTNLCGVKMTQNVANEGGGAIFFVSNNKSGTLTIDQSSLTSNPSKGFETVPGIFIISKSGSPVVTDSTIN